MTLPREYDGITLLFPRLWGRRRRRRRWRRRRWSLRYHRLHITASALDEWVLMKLVLINILDDGKIELLRSVRRLLEALDEAGIKEGLRQSRNWKMESEAVE